MADILLSAGVRSNLLALQQTSDLIQAFLLDFGIAARPLVEERTVVPVRFPDVG